MAELTELQRDILKEKRDNPDDGPKEIAERLGCSESHAYQTLKNYDTAHLETAEIKESSSDDTGNSSSPGLFTLLFIKPIEISLWLTVKTIEFTVWLIIFPLDLLFGNSKD